MTTVYFEGDANLDGDGFGSGHFTHAREHGGRPRRIGLAETPLELCCEREDGRTYLDEERFLPYVPFDPDDRAQRRVGFAVDPGQGMGVAKLTHTANCTVLAMHDRTGDSRGNSYAIFWTKGRLAAKEMRAAVESDFPRIWARINAAVPVVILDESESREEPIDLSIPDELFARPTEPAEEIRDIAKIETSSGRRR